MASPLNVLVRRELCKTELWDGFTALTGNGEPAESHTTGQGDRSHERSAGVGQHEEKRGFHAKTSAVENLSDASRGQDTVFPYVIG